MLRSTRKSVSETPTKLRLAKLIKKKINFFSEVAFFARNPSDLVFFRPLHLATPPAPHTRPIHHHPSSVPTPPSPVPLARPSPSLLSPSPSPQIIFSAFPTAHICRFLNGDERFSPLSVRIVAHPQSICYQKTKCQRSPSLLVVLKLIFLVDFTTRFSSWSSDSSSSVGLPLPCLLGRIKKYRALSRGRCSTKERRWWSG